MMRTCVFVDTNLLLQYQMFDQLNWNSFASSDDVELDFSPVVLRELDRKKFSETSQRLRDRAGRVVRKIWEALGESGSAVVKPGLKARYIAREPAVDYKALGLDKDIADDVLIASAIEAHGCEGARVVIATADYGLRLKAKSLGIETIGVPDEFRLPEQLDDSQRQIREMRVELEALKNAAPKLAVTFEGSQTYIEPSVTRRTDPSEDEVADRIALVRKKFPHLPVPTGVSEIMASMDPMRVQPSQIREYNESLNEFYSQCAVYFRSASAVFEQVDKTLMLQLFIHNDGTLTAEGVDVTLTPTVDASVGRWRRNKPEQKKPPTPPSRPISQIERINAIPNVLMPNTRAIHARRENVDGPSFIKSEPSEIHFNIELIKPKVPVMLPQLYFEFASFEAAKPFGIHYVLSAKNMRAPESGTVHIKVTQTSQAATKLPDA